MNLDIRESSQYTDDEFLKKIVATMQFIIHAFPEQIIGIKNKDSLHVYCSPYYLALLELSPDQIMGQMIVGSIYHHLLCPKNVREEDISVMQQKSPLTFLKFMHLKDGIKPRAFVKSPLINPVTSNCVGLIYHGFEYGTLNFNQQMLNLQGSLQENIAWDNLKIKLTRREKQVIFFFLANLNSQEIADMIFRLENKRIAKSTIDSLFTDQLYVKFGVFNRPALYEKLIQLNFDSLIPQEVLIDTSYPLKKHNVY